MNLSPLLSMYEDRQKMVIHRTQEKMVWAGQVTISDYSNLLLEILGLKHKKILVIM